MPKQFDSYEKLQEYFNYNAVFDNDVLLRASQYIHFDKDNFKTHKFVDGEKLALERGRSLGLYMQEDGTVLNAPSGYSTKCCW